MDNIRYSYFILLEFWFWKWFIAISKKSSGSTKKVVYSFVQNTSIFFFIKDSMSSENLSSVMGMIQRDAYLEAMRYAIEISIFAVVISSFMVLFMKGRRKKSA